MVFFHFQFFVFFLISYSDNTTSQIGNFYHFIVNINTCLYFIIQVNTVKTRNQEPKN